MSTLDWLEQNDYPLLLLLFLHGMGPYGCGDIRQTPIACTPTSVATARTNGNYQPVLPYFTPDILRFFAGQNKGYFTGFHQVFVQYAARNVTGDLNI
ncbi:hypothetical protein K439DRAFT_1639784 [Ramaria rubella]|nr:hypothetical protein K439DRAFT_1639784 [Ramaria rubella]